MKELNRRDALKAVAAMGALASGGCMDTVKAESNTGASSTSTTPPLAPTKETSVNPVQKVEKLPPQGPWPTRDPFLFCVHHNDQYPEGNGSAGPDASLAGRAIGSDFSHKDNWSMYHGQKIAGFPRHPHRGFETITVVKRGLIDHADSLGAAARYGDGDVQWLTAGDGINHAEMFPLLKEDAPNPTDFYQIWINLPAAKKRVPPYFSMFWDSQIPKESHGDEAGKKTEITVVAGPIGDSKPLSPPPDSWASQDENQVAVWTFEMEPGAQWTIPAGESGLNRTLYLVKGSGATVGDTACGSRTLVELQSDVSATIVNGDSPGEFLVLQGKAINEPVARRGPFVMNTWDEIREAYSDYQRTQFGGWPWNSIEPVHGMTPERFARRGKDIEVPT